MDLRENGGMKIQENKAPMRIPECREFECITAGSDDDQTLPDADATGKVVEATSLAAVAESEAARIDGPDSSISENGGWMFFVRERGSKEWRRFFVKTELVTNYYAEEMK